MGEGEEGYEDAATRGWETCQLRGRHWIITDARTGEAEHVRGEGVVGKYPLLRAKDYRDDDQGRRGLQAGALEPYPFVYQSCSGRLGEGLGGTFGGELVMVPGSLAEPTGPDFEIRVETFPLQSPEDSFIF